MIDWMRTLGGPEDFAGTTNENLQSNEVPPTNSHIHLPPNFSAFDSVEQAIGLAKEQGIGVLGASNYYDFSVYEDFSNLARQAGIFPLFGLEIIAMQDDLREAGIRANDPGNPGKMYICGKGITAFSPMSPRAAELMKTIRENDIERISEMIAKTEELFSSFGIGAGLDYSKIVDQVAKRHNCPAEKVYLQERHIAQAFQVVLFEKVSAEDRVNKLEMINKAKCDKINDPVQVQGHIRSTLLKAGKPCFVGEKFLNLKQAKELISELGGIACYPVLADGAKEVCQWESPVEKLIESLKANEIEMAEFIPGRNSVEVLNEYVPALHKAGIAVVAGTEHNTTELSPLVSVCSDGSEIPDELKKIFWQGICVVAGHQFMKSHGKEGYKSEQVDEFTQIGQNVLRKFSEQQ